MGRCCGISLLLAASAPAALVGSWTYDDNTLTESSGYKPTGTHDGLAIGNIGYTTELHTAPWEHSTCVADLAR